MALVKAKPAVPINYTSEIAAKIQQRRLQILVHSRIYYILDTTVVDDFTWKKWADELVQLQKEYPELSRKVIYAKEFEDFDGSTGYHLPLEAPQIISIVNRLLNVQTDEQPQHTCPLSNYRKEKKKNEQKSRKRLF